MLKMNFLKIFPSNIAYSDCIMLAYHSHLFLQIYYLKYSPVYTIPSIHTFYYHFISQSIWFCHSLCVLIFCFLHFFMYSLMLFFPWNILKRHSLFVHELYLLINYIHQQFLGVINSYKGIFQK